MVIYDILTLHITGQIWMDLELGTAFKISETQGDPVANGPRSKQERSRDSLVALPRKLSGDPSAQRRFLLHVAEVQERCRQS